MEIYRINVVNKKLKGSARIKSALFLIALLGLLFSILGCMHVIANCLEIQVKPHYTQAMSYDRDLRLRALEYAKEGHSLTQTARVFKQLLLGKGDMRQPAT